MWACRVQPLPKIPRKVKAEKALGSATFTVDVDVECAPDAGKSATDKSGKFKIEGRAAGVAVTAEHAS
jgi:hypothetical protein